MASNPPFQVEDQTDEDFFDKLVDEDDDDVDLKAIATSSAAVFADGNESDEIKAFANLNINEADESVLNDKKMADNDLGGKFESDPNGEVKEEVGGDTGGVVGVEQAVVEESNGALESLNSFDFGALESSNSFGFADAVGGNKENARTLESTKSFEFASAVGGNQENAGTEVLSNSTFSESGQFGATSVKEVQWSAFSTGREQNDNTAFGSYSDFFSELGENAGESSGNMVNNFGYEATSVSGNHQVQDSAYMQTSSYGNYQDGYNYGTEGQQTTGVQDQNSIEYMESLYPGWKIDPATGQWYKVDDNNLSASVQGVADSTGDWAASDGKSDVSYLQNSVQSVAGTATASVTTGSVTNWNQVSHLNDTAVSESNWNQVSQASGTGGSTLAWNQGSPENHEYPPHMVFDSQYPDWYYDTNTQEWCRLETYFASLQPAAEAQNQIRQDETGSIGAFSGNDHKKVSDVHGSVGNYSSQGFGAEAQDYNRVGSFAHYNQQGSDMWPNETAVSTRSSSDYRQQPQQPENHYAQNFGGSNHIQQQLSSGYGGTVPYYEKTHEVQNRFSPVGGSQNFVNDRNFSYNFNQPRNEQKEHNHVPGDYFALHNSVNLSQQPFHGAHQFSHAPDPGRSSAGRPPCALVTFGFGGKLIVAKGSNSVGASSFENQNPIGSSISVLNVMEVVAEGADASDYLRPLCRQSFPGPLSGGSAGLNKWIDERISNTESPGWDYRKGEVLRLLLSLLKISVQYQGKLRSPFGADTILKQNEAEAAIAKLFASSKVNGRQFNEYGPTAQCLQKLPSEGQLLATAAEVQSLLVSGRKKEALQCAQVGQLWGPALVLAAQLGDQFYVDTVKQMALKQLVAGSPLRTLCLLIAGQPADVFTTDATAINSMSAGGNIPHQPTQFGVKGMLDDWKENLAVITANRTKDDELVLIHLGDCLWKENSDVMAAHTCYLVAEASFEPYSDTARLCLVGADHWKFPRTYASPEAIQRTEIYEYSKVLGNPQFILLPFQPYKLIYAHMLVEVGRVSDALKYCQAVLKALKNGRSPEVETLRQLASSLEDRIKSHQQGGFSTNLAPAKLVTKFLNLFDSTAHRVVGGLPPPPSTSGGNAQSNESYQQLGPRVSASQSTMAMSSLVPSASTEPLNEWAADGSRRAKHNRSVSEPDFGRTPRQDQVDASKEESSTGAQVDSSNGGTSRFGRFTFGSQIFQKILKPRQGRQAKLGDENKFYFDKNLNTWVEKGAGPPAMETVPPPPPTSGFQNGVSDYNLKTALKSESSLSNGSPELKSPPSDQGGGMPPLPPTSNQFSARARTGVRSRYVDTFNKGGGNQANFFQSPSASSIKPSISAKANAKFFVPGPVLSNEDTNENNTESIQATTNHHRENPSVSGVEDSSQSPPPLSSTNMQRFGSMGNISTKAATANGPFLASSRRTASWSGGSFPENADVRPSGEVLQMPPSVTRAYGDELQEVEL